MTKRRDTQVPGDDAPVGDAVGAPDVAPEADSPVKAGISWDTFSQLVDRLKVIRNTVVQNAPDLFEHVAGVADQIKEVAQQAADFFKALSTSQVGVTPETEAVRAAAVAQLEEFQTELSGGVSPGRSRGVRGAGPVRRPVASRSGAVRGASAGTVPALPGPLQGLLLELLKEFVAQLLQRAQQ